ncbi:MAG: MarR family transcriptional regulator [Gammaproteobacteria bacterium]
MSPEDRLCEDVLVALRQIVRAIDLHSKKLVQRHGVTGPQMLVLKKLAEAAPLAVGELARRANLSQATVTDILDRMQRRGLVSRMRSEADKRRVLVTLTAEGTRLLETSPPLLQDSFVAGFQELPRWEQTAMVATVQRIAAMMNAEQLAAPPLLDNARIDAAGLDEAALDDAMLSEDSTPREA